MEGKKIDVLLDQEAEQLSLRQVSLDSHLAEYGERSENKQHKSTAGSKRFKMLRAEGRMGGEPGRKDCSYQRKTEKGR